MRLTYTNAAFTQHGIRVPGVPVLLNEDMSVAEGPQRWLFHIALDRGRTRSPATWRSYAEALFDWLQTCQANGWQCSLTNTGEIPHIPMDIAVPFILAALRWVREHGPEIAMALERAEAEYAGAAAQGKCAAWYEIAALRELRGFRFLHPPVLDGQPLPKFLTGLLQLRRLVRLAVTASFIVVAALTGMRASELLGLEEDCLETTPLEDGGDDSLLYVTGKLVKTAGTPHGERVHWVAGIDGPDNHVRAAVELLRRLTVAVRARSAAKPLFLGIALRPGKRPLLTPATR